MEYRITPIPPYKSSFAKRINDTQHKNVAMNESNQTTKARSSWPHLQLSQSSQPALPNPIREYSLPSVAHQTMVNRWIQSATNAKRRNGYNTQHESQPIHCNANNNSYKKNDVEERLTQVSKQFSSNNCNLLPPTQPRTFVENTPNIIKSSANKNAYSNTVTGIAPATSNRENTMTLQRVENNPNDNAEVVSLLKQILEQFTTFTTALIAKQEDEHKDHLIKAEEAKELQQQEQIDQVHQESKATMDALSSVLSSMLTVQQSQSDLMRNVQQELLAIHDSIKVCISVMQKQDNHVKESHEHKQPLQSESNNNYLNQTTQTDNTMTSMLSKREHNSHALTREKQLKKEQKRRRKTCHIILNQTQCATQQSVHEPSRREQNISEYTQVISQLPAINMRRSSLCKSRSSKVRYSKSSSINNSSNKNMRLHKIKSSQIKRHASRSSAYNVPLVLGCQHSNIKCYTKDTNNFVGDDDEESLFT